MANTYVAGAWHRLTSFFAANGDVFTAMGWVYPTTLTGNYHTLWGMEAQIVAQIHNSSGYKWSIGTAAADVDGAATVSANTWYHIALVRNGTSKILYLNGVSQVSGTESVTGSTTFTVSAWNNNSVENFIGRQAALKIWSGSGSALSAAEIVQEMYSYVPIRHTNLRAYYPFLPTQLTTDYSGQGRTLVAGGSGQGSAEGPGILWKRGRSRVYSYSASGLTNYDLTLNSGAYDLTGQTNSLLAGRTLTLDGSSYTITGQDNGLLLARAATLETGSYSITGNDSSLLADRVLTLNGEDYNIDGSSLEMAVETGPWGGPPVLTAYDSFNRADGDLDGDTASDTIHTWTVHAGTFNIVSNEILPQSGGVSRATLDTNISDVDVTLRVVTTAGSSTAGIIFRYIDENNYLLFMAQGGSSFIQTRVAGSDSFVTVGVGIVAGTTYRVRAVGNTITAYRTPSGGSESTLIATHTNNNHVTATRIGITAYRETTLTLDDLNAYNLSYLLDLDSGSYTLTGNTASLLLARALSLETGSYGITGSVNSLLAARTITLDSGSYTITGFDATLSNQLTYSLTLDSGSYALTGSDNTTLYNRALLAESGVYTLTGQDNSLLRTAIITLVPGSYTTTGFDTGLLRGLALSLNTGSYSLTGFDLTFTLDVISFSEWAELTTLPSPAAYSTTDSQTELDTFNNVFQYTTYRV